MTFESTIILAGNRKAPITREELMEYRKSHRNDEVKYALYRPPPKLKQAKRTQA